MFLWHRLQTESRPILIYGMGNGAEKILSLSQEYGITISGIFASNDHARTVEFRGYRVMSYDEALEKYTDAVILIAFGVYQEDVLRRIEALGELYTILVPDLPLMGGEILTPETVEKSHDSINAARSLFSDDKSRLVFDAMLEVKLTGDLSAHFREDTPREADMKLLGLSDREHYLDLGAYNGDTIREFLKLTEGKYASIDAFEPDAHNYRKLSDFTKSI